MDGRNWLTNWRTWALALCGVMLAACPYVECLERALLSPGGLIGCTQPLSPQSPSQTKSVQNMDSGNRSGNAEVIVVHPPVGSRPGSVEVLTNPQKETEQ